MKPLSDASDLNEVVAFLIGYIDLVIPLLVTIAVLLLMYAGFRYVYKAAETRGKGPEREAILWSLIALFIILSVWGLLRIMCTSFTGSPSCRTHTAISTSNAILH